MSKGSPRRPAHAGKRTRPSRSASLSIVPSKWPHSSTCEAGTTTRSTGTHVSRTGSLWRLDASLGSLWGTVRERKGKSAVSPRLTEPNASETQNPKPECLRTCLKPKILLCGWNCETGQPGLEPGIAGFGDRCLVRQWPFSKPNRRWNCAKGTAKGTNGQRNFEPLLVKNGGGRPGCSCRHCFLVVVLSN